MKTLELEVDEVKSPEEVVNFFKENDMSEGDTLKISTDEENLAFSAILFIIALAIVFYFTKEKVKRIVDGEKMLDDLFNGKSAEEMEKQIEEEYGVKIEIEHRENDERKDWGMLSMQGLSHAYGDDEPDYSDVPLIETNPDYKPWK
ncbi:MAG TPA: hypothetical protein VE978_23405 [Chitinophagales bacterium]|nr:hypothetical protein [Chitinophagales bacterium]